MSNITLLKEEQVWGDNRLNIFKQEDPRAAVSDFCILRGAYVSDYHVDSDSSLSGRTGYYWLQNSDGDGDARAVIEDGTRNSEYCDTRDGSCRAALPYSSIQLISPNFVRGSDGISKFEYGEYPQTAVSKDLQNFLEREYQRNSLKNTGKTYTTDSRKYDAYSEGFSPEVHIEYEYNGEKYVRVKANSDFGGGSFTLSNGEKYKDGDYVWVKVEKIVWKKHPNDSLVISEKCLFSGVRFYKDRGGYDGDFNKAEIKWFIDNFFSKDININQNLNINQKKSVNQKQINPYNFKFNQVSEEDIIKGSVESGIGVFLHGQSSEGKSARVKQLDPDLEIVYLRNATPDSLNGKSVYNSNTGEMIDVPPTWYKKLKEKCDKEPDKIHIVFFDEITNALPSIQGMVYNIVLDREVNGIWRLPKNARVVAAGNDLQDSLAANQLAEPLFNRFAHVYIKTELNDWLKWASGSDEELKKLDYKELKKERRIHPAIYAFIAYRGEEVLRSKYTGEKPNADPRKWEMASKILYKTKQPEMLRALIGEDLTREFCAFCRMQVITLDDVINDNYDDNIFNMDIASKYIVVSNLSMVDEENLEKVREFVLKLGKEMAAVFDSLWIRGDTLRAEKIAELRVSDLDFVSEGGVKR